ncbi:unnamed protein product [Brugia pahangi]|uniref:Activin_recp domain-containing protein n=1 Tax=Brugia pahangi TaxID=6280 RepID=A0A158PPZ9_BRUPA|nr:unnamed protein product [Brugia pahangi]
MENGVTYLLCFVHFNDHSSFISSSNTVVLPESLSNSKRKCFQCNMPYECNLGLCYGDYCIKSLGTLVNGESYTQENSESIEKPYCTTEYMFGIQNIICYCNDVDFCNRSQKIEARLIMISLFLFLMIFNFIF